MLLDKLIRKKLSVSSLDFPMLNPKTFLTKRKLLVNPLRIRKRTRNANQNLIPLF
jgi:hypothetical protein